MKVKHSKVKLITFTATSTLLLACSHNSPAPVFDLSPKMKNQINKQQSTTNQTRTNQTGTSQSFYIVKPGDTLFSIAWEHSVDYKNLAKINKLKHNLIYPNQKLLLVEPKAQSFFDSESLLLALHRDVLNRPMSSNSVSLAVSTNQKSNSISKFKPNNNRQSKIISNEIQTARVTPIPPQQDNSEEMLNWIWPTDGKLLNRFSSTSSASRGLDIEASQGQAVRATAPGRVVYGGNGLRGYGNLVIIKHSQNYLSAYAHNDKIHVSENEIVKSGQRIADVGSSGSGTQKSLLHFEIRYKGKPVDPLNYLPEKKF